MKLPGKDSNSPQSFPFGTPYVEIRDFLARQNEALFRRNSVLGLLERDAATKRAPERWQSLDSEDVASFDVVVCFESRVFDLVVEGSLVVFSVGVKSCSCQCCCRCVVDVRQDCDRAEVQGETESVFVVTEVSETECWSGGLESDRVSVAVARRRCDWIDDAVLLGGNWKQEPMQNHIFCATWGGRLSPLPFFADNEAPLSTRRCLILQLAPGPGWLHVW